MSADPLNLKPDETTAPIIRLTLQIIGDAIKLKADAILLELDTELHREAHGALKVLRQAQQEKSITIDRFFFELARLPMACKLIYEIGGKQQEMAPLSGELFGNFINILLLATGIPPWTKGLISAPLETVKPTSKWMLESNDVTRRIQLRRIRKN